MVEEGSGCKIFLKKHDYIEAKNQKCVLDSRVSFQSQQKSFCHVPWCRIQMHKVSIRIRVRCTRFCCYVKLVTSAQKQHGATRVRGHGLSGGSHESRLELSHFLVHFPERSNADLVHQDKRHRMQAFARSAYEKVCYVGWQCQKGTVCIWTEVCTTEQQCVMSWDEDVSAFEQSMQ